MFAIFIGVFVIGLLVAAQMKGSNAPTYSTIHPQSPAEGKMVTTSIELAGYEVVESLGVVRGITVRSRSVVGTWFGGMQSILGGNLTVFTQLCEQARAEAFHLMVEHANAIGANAIIAHRMDSTELGAGISEVLAYGTAVQVRKIVATEQSQ
jgi:uncharacterized protein YbjQ (UPF0145 family)